MRIDPRAAFLVLAAVAAGPATQPAPPANPGNPPAAQRTPLPPVGQVRQLQGQEYSAAVDARDNADQLRAAYENARSRQRRAQAAPPPAANDPEFDHVVAAYRQVIVNYPGTQFEHDCRLRLAGAYQYRGQFDRTLEETKQNAERFAGTKLGMESLQAVALTYLQALHDPAQAAAWFDRLKSAAGTLRDEDERLKWQVAATQGLARCETERGAGKK